MKLIDQKKSVIRFTFLNNDDFGISVKLKETKTKNTVTSIYRCHNNKIRCL